MNDKIDYTESKRDDGFWAADLGDDGELEVYVRRENGSIRPICKMEDPDILEGGKCAGNFALVCAAPKMYDILFETSKLMRFMILRPSSTEAERAEFRSLLLSVDEAIRGIAQIEEGLKVEANIED